MKVNSQSSVNYHHQGEGDQFDIKSVILKYARFWHIFLGSVFLAFLTAFLVNQSTQPVYKVQGKFLIKEEDYSIDLLDNTGRKNPALPKGQKIANESIIIKSRSTAEDVLDRLPFDVEYYDDGFFRDTELYKNSPLDVRVDWNHAQLTNGKIKISWTNDESFHLEFVESEYQRYTPGDRMIQQVETPQFARRDFSFGEWVQFPDGRFMVNLTGHQQSGSVDIIIRDRESLIYQYTGESLQVTPADKISSILVLTLDTHQPYKGRDYLNMLMKIFLDNELDEKNRIATNTINFIDSQISGISDSLHNTGNKLENYRSRNRTYDITSEGNSLYETLLELEKTLSQEKFKHQYFQTLQQHLTGEQYGEITIPSGLGIDDPLLNNLIQDLVTFNADKSRFLATQTENSPAVIEVNRKISSLKMSLMEALRSANQSTSLVIADLSSRIARIERQFGRLPQTEQDLLNMKRRYSLNESIYTFLLQRRAEASIILASNTPSNKIIEDAVLNLIPLRLRPLLNYFLAGILGLLIPFGIIFFKDLFSTKLEDLSEVEQKLSVPVIGYIERNHKSSLMVVLKHSRARIAESFRALRTNIDFLVPPEKQLAILITSTISGEGKSFCSLNLASVYSACDRKTIIVRCDLHKPFAFDSLGISNNVGLSNYLSGQLNDLNDLIQMTDHPNLDVIVPGPVPPNPAELLIGDRFKNLLIELRKRYDVIVLDSSPLGVTNETLYITRLVDVTIFILRQKYSSKNFINHINSLKEKKKVRKLYALLNDIDDKDLSYKGSGYGYYEEEEDISSYRKIINMIANKAAI